MTARENHFKRFAIPALIAILLLGGTWFAVRLLWKLPAVETWQGYVDADYVRVGPTLQGRLTEVAVRRGDQVTAGQLLFAQDDADDIAARNQAEAQMRQAGAQLANIQVPARRTLVAEAQGELDQAIAAQERVAKDLARGEILVPSGAVSRQSVDQQRADFKAAQGRVASARAALDERLAPTGRNFEITAQQNLAEAQAAALARAEWRVAQRRASSPLVGQVAEVYARSGETLDAGAPVVALLSPANLVIRFFVPEARVQAMTIGTNVFAACDGCGGPLAALVTYIAPQAEYTPPVIYSEATKAKLVFLVEARFIDRAAMLRPGLPVTVRRSR